MKLLDQLEIELNPKPLSLNRTEGLKINKKAEYRLTGLGLTIDENAKGYVTSRCNVHHSDEVKQSGKETDNDHVKGRPGHVQPRRFGIYLLRRSSHTPFKRLQPRPK